MKIEDFLKQLNTEPNSTDPEFVAARRESLQHAAAAKEAAAFEERLAAALNVPVNPELADQILDHCLGERKRFTMPVWLSAAAGVVFALGIGIFAFQQNTGDIEQLHAQVRAPFVEHFDLREYEPMWHQHNPVTEADTEVMLADYGLNVNGTLDGLTYLKRCRIGDQWGLHMVMTNGEQKTTVMYLPYDNAEEMEHDFQLATGGGRLIELAGGIAVLFSHDGQPLDPVEELLKQQLSADTAIAFR